MATASPNTVVLAAQLHATDGRRRGDDEALRLLKARRRRSAPAIPER